MNLYLRFPDYELASGRWARVEIFTQDVSAGIGACYNDPGDAVTAVKNPWLQGGLPVPSADAAPDAGMIGSDAVEFSYCGIAVHNGLSLHAIIMAEPYDLTAWNIRLYTKPNAAAAFSFRPDFWGIIDTSEPDGEIMSSLNDGPNKYKLIARNRLALLERVNVLDWITGYLPYNTVPYELAPDKIMIDGEELQRVFFAVPDTPLADFDANVVRFVSLKAVLRSISDAIGLDKPINYHDLIRSSWVFHATDGSGNPTTHMADDLVIVSGIRIPTYWFWHYTFFDWETNTDISFFNVGDLMQVLKQILVPLGLQASVEVKHQNGESYMEIREIEQASGVVCRRLIRGATLEPGEHAARGIRIVIAEDGEFSVNGTGDQSIDCCFQSATRIRAGERWIEGGRYPRNTDDMRCLMGSLWLYDSVNNIVSNVTGITVKSDGRSASLVTPSAVSLDLGGKMVGQAAAKYYYNTQNTTVSELGIFRFAMQQLEFRMMHIHDDVEGATDAVATNRLNMQDAFTDVENVYKYRRVRNDTTGEEANVIGKDNDDTLELDADIFPTIGHAFVVLGPRVGHFVEMPNGRKWVIRSLALNARELTTDIAAEKESFDG